MDNHDIHRILIEILGLDPSKIRLRDDTLLLGHVPEFDSMAVVSVLTAIEDQFGVVIDDDEVDASIFETVGSLCGFVARKTGVASR